MVAATLTTLPAVLFRLAFRPLEVEAMMNHHEMPFDTRTLKQDRQKRNLMTMSSIPMQRQRLMNDEALAVSDKEPSTFVLQATNRGAVHVRRLPCDASTLLNGKMDEDPVGRFKSRLPQMHKWIDPP